MGDIRRRYYDPEEFAGETFPAATWLNSANSGGEPVDGTSLRQRHPPGARLATGSLPVEAAPKWFRHRGKDPSAARLNDPEEQILDCPLTLSTDFAY